MISKIIWLLIVFLHFFGKIGAQSLDLITLNEADLIKIKTMSMSKSDKSINASKMSLIYDADIIVRKKVTYSVTFNKNLGLNSSDNDYMSFGRYLWPNPNTKTGFPYVVKDGLVNKDSDKLSDKKYIDAISNDILILGLAYYYSENDAYVDWAMKLLKIFFVNERTKMHPNFDFSQVTPGVSQSGGSIMEAVVLLNLIDGVQLLSRSSAFDKKLRAELEDWFGKFLFWLENTNKGNENSKHINNRGTYYTALKCGMYLFTNEKDKAEDIFKSEAFERINKQIESDGSMPLELKRTKPLGYVKYNLVGFNILINMGRRLKINLLDYNGPKGQSIKKAKEWLENFRSGRKRWNYSDEVGVTYAKIQSLKKMGITDLTPFRFSADRYDNYLTILTSIR